MASPMPLLSIIFAVGMIIGGAVLAALPLAPERAKPLVTNVRVADLAAPCKRQGAAKDERGCTTRTAQRSDALRQPVREAGVQRIAQEFEAISPPALSEIAAAQWARARPAVILAAKVTPAAAPSPRQRVATAFAQLPPVTESIAMSPPPADALPAAVEGAERPLPAERPKSEATRPPRYAAAPVPITAVGANGARRTILIRPTSRQDFFYYAARRQFAATNATQPR